MATGKIAQTFITQTYSQSVTIAANNYQDVWFEDIAIEGYTAIGIIHYAFRTNTWCFPSFISVDNNVGRVIVRNMSSSSVTIKLEIRVLYKKN